MARNLAADFVGVSLVYFLIGAFWMGFGEFIPGPQQAFAQEPYMWARVHVMVLGWATFALFGVLYYFIPQIVGKAEIFSKKLGSIHFWITNITFPIVIILLIYGSFAIDSLIANGVPEEQALSDPSIMPLFLSYIVVFVIGFAAQFIFAYNVYKTMAAKG